MPVKVTKYRCAFKCGKLAMQNYEQAVKHEKGCFKNPDNKTCETCINRIYERDTDEWRTWHYRDCLIKPMSDFLEEVHDILTMDNGVHHVRPLFNCPNHNKNEVQPETETYINSVREKLLNKQEEIKQNNKILPF